MKKINYLSRLDSEIFEMVWYIGRQADTLNLRAYLVGGLVRDLILKRKTVVDVDIVVEGNAINFAQHVADYFKGSVRSYAEFGTATLLLPSGCLIDFVSARSEIYERSGALPRVANGTIGEDLFRRDFTINAIAIQINQTHFGQVLDFFGGMEDLKRRQLRVMHAQSFIDDPTRLIRAIRFEQRFGFEFEKETLSLLKQSIRQGAPAHVSRPRYFTQFLLMLSEPDVFKNLSRLRELQGFDFLMKANLLAVKNLQAQMQKERKVQLAEHMRAMLYLFALADGVSIKMMSEYLDKFQFRKEDRALFDRLKDLDDVQHELRKTTVAPSRLYRLLNNWDERLVWYLFYRSNFVQVKKHIMRFWNLVKETQLNIDGDDIKALGCKAGNRVRVVLESVLDQKLDGMIRGRKQELELAQRLLKEPFLPDVKS